MRGLKDTDFAMWNPGHLIAKGIYATPNRGNFLSLVECGHVNLAWTPLFELYVGKGSIVAIQLPILEDVDTEPMAAELWRRLLGYLVRRSTAIRIKTGAVGRRLRASAQSPP